MGNAKSDRRFLNGISLHEVFNCVVCLHVNADKQTLFNLTIQVVTSLIRDQGMALYLNRGSVGTLLQLDENSQVISVAIRELCYLPARSLALAERVWFVEFESEEFADA